MWVQLTDKSITNMSHVVHVSCDSGHRCANGKIKYYVRLYGAGGKCFEALDFESDKEAEDMFNKIVTFCNKSNQGIQTELFSE